MFPPLSTVYEDSLVVVPLFVVIPVTPTTPFQAPDASELKDKLKEFGEYDPKLELSKYVLPNIDLMESHGDGNISVNKDELEANKNSLEELGLHCQDMHVLGVFKSDKFRKK